MEKLKSMKITQSLRIRNMHLPSHAIMALWAIVVIFPLYIMVTGSFKGKLEIYENTFGLPRQFNISNYAYIFSEENFLVYFKNSFIAVTVSLILVLALGVLIAYALANWRNKISNAVYFLFIAGMTIPLKIASIRLLEIIKSLGLLSSIWGLVPIYVAMGLPIAVFVITEFIRQLPRGLIEAALVDGASHFKIMLNIVLPLTRPALASVAIYNLIPFWNDLWFPMVLQLDATKDSMTLILGVTRLFGQYKTDWSRVLAVLTLASIPVFTLYLLMSQQFIKGMTSGAIKE